MMFYSVILILPIISSFFFIKAKEYLLYFSGMIDKLTYSRLKEENVSISWKGMMLLMINKVVYIKRKNKKAKKQKTKNKKQKKIKLIIIVGLPRTGSTMLHRLLSLHDECIFLTPREVLFGDLNVGFSVMNKAINYIIGDVMKSHPVIPDQAEEETFLMDQYSGCKMFINCFTDDVQEYSNILMKTYTPLAYKINKIIRKEKNKSKSHIVIKSPFHSYNLESLKETFYDYDVKIIETEREIEKVIPSTCRLFESISKIYTSGFNKKYIGKVVVKHINHLLECLNKHKNIIDYTVRYEDIVLNTIITIKKIYSEIGVVYDDNDLKFKIEKWLKENPQGKYGRAKYSMSEYGLE